MIGRIWERIKAATGRVKTPVAAKPSRPTVHTGSREIERRLRQQARREQKKGK